MSVQCRCGRYLANAHPVVKLALDPYLEDVRGDCGRCGSDVSASRESDASWWFSWDAWPGLTEWADVELTRIGTGDTDA